MADIDLKTLTPDTSLPTTGFLFGADSQATASPSVYGVTTAITAILGNAASSDVLSFNSDTIVLRDAANILAQRNGVTAQAKRVYKTYTDASNYERGVFDWTTTANQLTIGTQKFGSGTARPLELQTDGTAVLTLATDGSVTQSGTYFKLNNRLATCQVWIGSESASSAFIGTITNTPFAFRANNTSWLTISTAGLLQLQGATSSFPAIKRSTTFLQARLADDSAFAGFASANMQAATAYTVATLPGTPGTGMIARVSDALAPAIGATVAAGGAAYALVNYNGANWTVIGV
jgi:hypothetical protein